MRDKFSEYYLPDFEQLWNTAIFVFDANVLLDLYETSTSASKEFLTILDGLKNMPGEDRIWMPHQFALEYHRNLVKVIARANKEYQNELEKLKGLPSETSSMLHDIETRSEYKIPPKPIEKVSKALEEIASETLQQSTEHEFSFGKHPLQVKIAELFEHNTGDLYKAEQLKEIYEEGEDRYAASIPPGYKDIKKEPESRRYGDLVGWKQIIFHAKYKEKSVIMISNDSRGEDWYYKHEGKLQGGPCPELRKEFLEKADKEFYLYQTGTFLKRAREYLQSQVSDESIEEFSESKFFDETHDALLHMQYRDSEDPLRPGDKWHRLHRPRISAQRDNLSFRTIANEDFANLELQGARFRSLMAERADFRLSNLKCAEFTDAVLFQCNFSGANLLGADFTGARMFASTFVGAIMPDGERYSEEMDMGKYTDPDNREYRRTRHFIFRLREDIGCD